MSGRSLLTGYEKNGRIRVVARKPTIFGKGLIMRVLLSAVVFASLAGVASAQFPGGQMGATHHRPNYSGYYSGNGYQYGYYHSRGWNYQTGPNGTHFRAYKDGYRPLRGRTVPYGYGYSYDEYPNLSPYTYGGGFR